MELIVFLIFWGLLAWGIGAWASSRGRSATVFGLLSFFFSPVLAGLVLLLMSDQKKAEDIEAKRRQERREEHERQLEEIRALRESPIAKPAANSVSIAEELERIAKLRQDGLITEEEFAELKKKLMGS